MELVFGEIEFHHLFLRQINKPIFVHFVFSRRKSECCCMWYFLRALWHKDGQTQRELSLLVGTMEPTTLSAIRTMEASGLVQRKRNDEDRRKINVFLTGRGRELENILMPLAKEVVDASVEGFSINERGLLLQYLKSIQNNILKHLDEDVHLG